MHAFSLLRFSSKRRLPILLQSEITECGLACLGMVASFHGCEIDLASLRAQYPLTSRGMTLSFLMHIADKMGLACRPLRVELEELEQVQKPAILHWDMNHFVVLKESNKKAITIHDPAQGVRKLSWPQVSKHFTGVAVECTPTSDFEPQKVIRKVPLWMFWTRIVGLKRALLQVLFLSFALQLFALLSPLYMQWVVDKVFLSADSTFLTVLAVGFFLLMIIDTGTTVLRSLLIMRLSALLNLQIATNVFCHLIRLPLSFFEKRYMGDILSRFGSLSQIEKCLTIGIVQAIVDGVMAVTTLIMLFLYSPFLASIVLVALSAYSLIRWVGYYPLKTLTEEAIVAGAKENSHFMETLRAMQSIKIFGRESQRQVLWQNRYAEKLNTGIQLTRLQVFFKACNGLVFGLENVVVIYVGAKLVMSAHLTIGMLFAFLSYKTQWLTKAISLIENIIDLKTLNLHLERLGDIVLEPKEKKENGLVSSFEGSIRVENLAFRYQDRFLFKEVSFLIRGGESVAVIGPSGCGKTTLMKVMMGLLSPTEGQIFVDEVPLEKREVSHFRSKIGAVMQEDQLLSGSIAENISFFDPHMDWEKIERCAKIAAIADEIALMPMGYQTVLGDMGITLSGGQKQRVILARALYRSPQILFLDEATSHLDVALEQSVNQAVQQLHMTRVIIAHRPETIRSADRVLAFTSEGVIEQTLLLKHQEVSCVIETPPLSETGT